MSTPFSQIAPTMNTGDILLLHGDEEVSAVTGFITGSPVSHVAMVVRFPGVEAPFLWQSILPYRVKEAVYHHAAHPGAQLGLMETILRKCREHDIDTFLYRRLALDRAVEIQKKFEEHLEAIDDRELSEILDRVANWPEGKSSLTCGIRTFGSAQLVARSFQRMELLPESPEATAYSPKDFCAAWERLKLLQEATLGEEIAITLDEPAKGEEPDAD